MQTTQQEFTVEQVNHAVDAIIHVLGTPENDLHAEALSAFRAGNHQRVKRLAATNLADYYCKALGYLGGALKLTPNTDRRKAEGRGQRAGGSYDETYFCPLLSCFKPLNSFMEKEKNVFHRVGASVYGVLITSPYIYVWGFPSALISRCLLPCPEGA